MALDPQTMQLLQAAMQQRQAGPQPSQGLQPLLGDQPAPMGAPGLLGGIGQPAPVNFANALGGAPPEDAFGFPGMGPLGGVMPQGQTQMPASAPGGQPGAFSPAGSLFGQLFARANQNSGPATPMQEKQFMARKNAFPVKQDAGALGGMPMGVQRF